jgi:hypothetical protein
MLKRTSCNRSLPLIKLGLIAGRQLAKPLVKQVVLSAKHHPTINTVCIGLGRISYGVSSLLFSWGQIGSSKSTTGKNEAEVGGGTPPGPAEGTPSTSDDTSKAVGADTPAATSSTPVGADDYKASLKLRPLPLRPRKHRPSLKSHFHPPVSDSVLRDAGAELLIELGAYLIAIVFFWYEFSQSSALAKEKEERLERRLAQLEAKINEIAAHHPEVDALADVDNRKRVGWFGAIAKSGRSLFQSLAGAGEAQTATEGRHDQDKPSAPQPVPGKNSAGTSTPHPLGSHPTPPPLPPAAAPHGSPHPTGEPSPKSGTPTSTPSKAAH